MRRSSIRVYEIRDFLDWQRRGQLDLSPRFQRKQVWLPKYQSYFLDTLIRGLPTGLIHLREKISGTKETIREVVDGQQRLRTIFDFHEDKIIISKIYNREYGEKIYSDLPFHIKEGFLGYRLAVNVLEDASDEEVLDIFARLNTYTVKLNRQELRNARYHGALKSVVYRLASESIHFFTSHNILSPRQIMRMEDAELVSEILVAMDMGLQDKKEILDEYYKKYDNEYAKSEVFSERYNTIIKAIANIFRDTLNETKFRRRTLFYSLFCVLYDVNFGLPGQNGPYGLIPESEFENAQRALQLLDQQITSDAPSEAYSEFVVACGRQTDNLKPRQIRHDTINSVLLPLVKR